MISLAQTASYRSTQCSYHPNKNYDNFINLSVHVPCVVRSIRKTVSYCSTTQCLYQKIPTTLLIQSVHVACVVRSIRKVIIIEFPLGIEWPRYHYIVWNCSIPHYILLVARL